MTDNTESIVKRAVLVGVNTGRDPDFDISMKELSGLAEACGYEVAGTSCQNLTRVENSTYIGKGKLQELKTFMEATDAGTAIFLNTLTPSQLSNLCTELDSEVLDKTGLILNIFSERANATMQAMMRPAPRRGSFTSRTQNLRQTSSPTTNTPRKTPLHTANSTQRQDTYHPRQATVRTLIGATCSTRASA